MSRVCSLASSLRAYTLTHLYLSKLINNVAFLSLVAPLYIDRHSYYIYIFF